MGRPKKSPLDIEVGIYRWGRQGGFYFARAETLRKVLTDNEETQRIKSYRATRDEKLKSKMKYAIEAFTPAGSYGKAARVINQPMESETLQVQLDFDKQKLDLKKLFKKYTWLTAAKPSCSGNGSFLLVNTPGKKSYEEYFWALVDFFEKKGMIVDQSVSSVNELRYCSVNEEGFVREYPSLWTESKAKPRTPITDIIIRGDKKVVELPASQLGEMHYQDAVPWIAKNNHNGTPPGDLLDYIKKLTPKKVFAAGSHLSKDMREVEKLIDKMYRKYGEQHGEGVSKGGAELMLGKKDVPDSWVEPVMFDEKESGQLHQVTIVEEVNKKYSFVYSVKTEEYFRYVGTHWANVEKHMVERFLIQASEAIGYPVKKASTLNFRKQLLELFTLSTSGEIKTDNSAFNLQNGILVFDDSSEEVKFIEHDPARMFCYVLDYDYNPKAKAPEFEKFINRVMPRKADQDLFFECIAGSFIHKLKLEYTLFLVGGGETGKSTLLNVVESLFGDACSSFSMRALTSKSDGDRAAREAYKIYNKSIALSRDDTGMSESTLWRKIASREPISVKTLYSNEFETTNYARLVLAVNEKPIIEASHAAQRRVIAIEMNERITEKEKDFKLIHKLVTERSGVLNLLIAGFRRLMKSGGRWTVSESATAMRKAIITESDIIGQWLDAENIAPCSSSPIGRGTILQRFEDMYGKVAQPGSIRAEQLVNLFSEKTIEGRDVQGTFTQWVRQSNEWTGMKYRKFRQSMVDRGFREFQDSKDRKMYVYIYKPK